MTMHEQSGFYRCQCCGKIVDRIFQKGYCRDCLVTMFKPLRSILDENHASLQAKAGDFNS
ncbi:MAG: hypothetical protein KDK41_06790 [Leptospiraceae bacterium]|nr:hypothetical protein [Leptospiraceae bacterium]MCB1200333.1 hypothetical protein [Leptospiraceae bacterium]